MWGISSRAIRGPRRGRRSSGHRRRTRRCRRRGRRPRGAGGNLVADGGVHQSWLQQRAGFRSAAFVEPVEHRVALGGPGGVLGREVDLVADFGAKRSAGEAAVLQQGGGADSGGGARVGGASWWRRRRSGLPGDRRRRGAGRTPGLGRGRGRGRGGRGGGGERPCGPRGRGGFRDVAAWRLGDRGGAGSWRGRGSRGRSRRPGGAVGPSGCQDDLAGQRAGFLDGV
jgi:hypothetical protein